MFLGWKVQGDLGCWIYRLILRTGRLWSTFRDNLMVLGMVFVVLWLQVLRLSAGTSCEGWRVAVQAAVYCKAFVSTANFVTGMRILPMLKGSRQ